MPCRCSRKHKRELRELNPDLAFKDDYYREDLPDYAMRDFEILIGETNRPESIEFIDSLRTKDYGYVNASGVRKRIERIKKQITEKFSA